MCKADAAVILNVGKEDMATNLADILTQLLHYSLKQEILGCLICDYLGGARSCGQWEVWFLFGVLQISIGEYNYDMQGLLEIG